MGRSLTGSAHPVGFRPDEMDGGGHVRPPPTRPGPASHRRRIVMGPRAHDRASSAPYRRSSGSKGSRWRPARQASLDVGPFDRALAAAGALAGALVIEDPASRGEDELLGLHQVERVVTEEAITRPRYLEAPSPRLTRRASILGVSDNAGGRGSPGAAGSAMPRPRPGDPGCADQSGRADYVATWKSRMGHGPSPLLAGQPTRAPPKRPAVKLALSTYLDR